MAAGPANWSSTLEDLLDDGNTQEAQLLLEGLVAELRARPDASTNLTLAAALSDLSSLYHVLGLSSRAHSASSSALLIKQTAQFCPPIRAISSNSGGDHNRLPEIERVFPDTSLATRGEGSDADREDLQPPVPRPATSSQAAHRMIMGALQRQGVKNKASPMSTFKTSQQQESERKQRLHMRQKLRDEAWGSES